MKNPNLVCAGNLIIDELRQLALSIPENLREDYFDGRNFDWMDAFIARLQKRYQQPDRIASND